MTPDPTIRPDREGAEREICDAIDGVLQWRESATSWMTPTQPDRAPVDPSERPTAFENPQKVEFRERRWSTHILITDSEGAEHEFIASADSFYTDRNGIWFGTRQEMERFDDDNS